MGDMEDKDEDGGGDGVLNAPKRLRCLSRIFSEFDSAGTSISEVATRGGSISAMISNGFL